MLLKASDESLSKIVKMFLGFSDIEILVFPYNDGNKITNKLKLGYLFAYYIG